MPTFTKDQVKSKLKESKIKPFGKKATQSQLNLLQKKILNQDIFKYPENLIPRYFLRCLCLHQNRRLKTLSKADFFLNQGLKKLDKDMDVV